MLLCSKCASGPIFAISISSGFALSPIFSELSRTIATVPCLVQSGGSIIRFGIISRFIKNIPQLAFNQSRRLLVSDCCPTKEARPLCEHKTGHFRKGAKMIALLWLIGR